MRLQDFVTSSGEHNYGPCPLILPPFPCRSSFPLAQIYPENSAQAEMIVGAAMKVGFSGGLVIDFPHSTRAKKYFMVLMVGISTASAPLPKGLDGADPDDEEGGRGEVRVSQEEDFRGQRMGGE